MMKVVKCPSCAAPLECDGDACEKCDFCGSQVAVTPENTYSPDVAGFGGLVQNALKLKEVLLLARGGKKIEAIKIYRKTFGAGLAEAKDAVERLEKGQSVNFQNVQFRSQQAIHYDFQKPQPIDIVTQTFVKGTKVIGGLTLFGIIVGGLVAVAGIGIAIYSVYKSTSRATQITSTSTPTSTPRVSSSAQNQFAKEILRFGGEGNGAGKFTDNRTIGVDGDGNIYSADYQGGRVQVFDHDGKFLTQWFVKEKDSVIYSLAASRKGTVFVTQPGKIMAYDGLSGNLVKESKLDSGNAVYPTLDNKILVANESDILVIDENLKTVSVFKNVAQSAGITDGFDYVATNGLGEIFAVSHSGKDLAKFSRDGKFVDRFKIKPTSVDDIAIDPKGRIFITDGSTIYVYQTDGNLVDSFVASQCFGLVFNDQGELITATRPFVVKYAVNP